MGRAGERDEVGKPRQRSLGLLIRRGWETSLMGRAGERDEVGKPRQRRGGRSMDW